MGWSLVGSGRSEGGGRAGLGRGRGQGASEALASPLCQAALLLAPVQGLLVQAEPLALAAWLASDSSALLLQPLAHPLSMPLPSAALLQSDSVAAAQCGKAFAAVQVGAAPLLPLPAACLAPCQLLRALLSPGHAGQSQADAVLSGLRAQARALTTPAIPCAPGAGV